MTDKWTPKLEAEYQKDASKAYPEFDRPNPEEIGRLLWLLGRTSGARDERGKVIAEIRAILRSVKTNMSLASWTELYRCIGDLRKRLEGLSHD